MPRDIKAHTARDMTEEEIRLKIRELNESLFNLRFRNAMRQLDNPLEIRNVRRDIAILRTVLTEHDKGIRRLKAGVKKTEGDDE